MKRVEEAWKGPRGHYWLTSLLEENQVHEKAIKKRRESLQRWLRKVRVKIHIPPEDSLTAPPLRTHRHCWIGDFGTRSCLAFVTPTQQWEVWCYSIWGRELVGWTHLHCSASKYERCCQGMLFSALSCYIFKPCTILVFLDALMHWYHLISLGGPLSRLVIPPKHHAPIRT